MYLRARVVKNAGSGGVIVKNNGCLLSNLTSDQGDCQCVSHSRGLTAPEFVDLRRIEVQKEIVQQSPSALTVLMGLERVGINMPPLASGQ